MRRRREKKFWEYQLPKQKREGKATAHILSYPSFDSPSRRNQAWSCSSCWYRNDSTDKSSVNLLLPSFSVCVPRGCDLATLYGPRWKIFVSPTCISLALTGDVILSCPSAKLCVARDSSVTPRQKLGDQPSSSWFKKQ